MIISSVIFPLIHQALHLGAIAFLLRRYGFGAQDQPNVNSLIIELIEVAKGWENGNEESVI